jgi:hypothetical protein
MVIDQAGQQDVSELLIATLAGILVLIVERIVTGLLERRKEARSRRNTKHFLRSWYREAYDTLIAVSEHYSKLAQEWTKYRADLDKQPTSDERTPGAGYERIVMPDISTVVVSALPDMPEDAYINLLFLNGRLKLIDDRGHRLSDMIDNLLAVKPDRDSRIRLSEVFIDAVTFIREVTTEALTYNYSNPGLASWINKE